MFGIPVKWIAICLAAAALAIALKLAVDGIEEHGRLKERDSINQQNEEAGNAGEAARLGLRECTARGLQFDFEAGKCRP